MKLAIPLALALVAGCLDAHPAGVTDVTQNDCQTCHQSNFQQAMADPTFPHPAGWAGACAACHSAQATPAWTFVHPSDPFPTMTGAHAQFFGGFTKNCHVCHDNNASADFLANIDCITACHNANAMDPGATQQSRDVHHSNDSNKAACFDCHPDGRAGH